MGNALWFFMALAQWYFPCVLAPFSAGPLTLIPAVGVVCLAIGAILGMRARAPSLLFFGVLALISHAYVALAGFLRGTMHDSNSPMFLVFLLLQVVLAGYLVYRVKGARLPAIFLAIFTSTYAFFASFIAAMSFSDTWL
jgi:hypothetical protein